MSVLAPPLAAKPVSGATTVPCTVKFGADRLHIVVKSLTELLYE